MQVKTHQRIEKNSDMVLFVEVFRFRRRAVPRDSSADGESDVDEHRDSDEDIELGFLREHTEDDDYFL